MAFLKHKQEKIKWRNNMAGETDALLNSVANLQKN